MTEYRVKGEIVARDNRTPVMTGWLMISEAEAEGIRLGCEIRGWENTEIQERERHND